MRFDKLTLKAHEALQASQGRAESLEHSQIEAEHVLESLIAQEEGVVSALLKKLGVAPEGFRMELEKHLKSLPKVHGAQLQMSSKLDAILRQAQKEADHFKDEYISTEHILLAISADSGGFAGDLLRRNGADHSTILKVLVAIRGTQRVTDPNAEDRYQSLKRYA